ncbi:MAG: HlyC/CorC family transporter [Deltaproteobacteria bacterium]|nr:HlyC/CorC family transporter [Candidatus Anaeroferrophillus wilburensis]MBN2890014.1 HlyC/CorC family transporter [Deltaproteobacteria bacterium]
MDSATIALLTALFLLLVLLSAFFSGTETALLTFRRYRLRYYSKKYEGQARQLKKTLKSPQEFIATVLVCNNFVNVAASALATYLCVYFFGNKGVVISTVVVTAILLIFAEITPKTYAASRSDTIALKIAGLFNLIIRLMRPMTRLMNIFTNQMIKVLDVARTGHTEPLFDEEIKSFILSGREKGALNHHESLMMHNILEIEKATVKEIMVPRQEVTMIHMNTPYAEIQRLVRDAGYSRYPVFSKSQEDIVGIIHIKDLLTHQFGKTFSLAQIIRPVLFIPEIMPLDTLLETFRQHKTHMAIVVDEYGGMEGLVTVEDLIEEIVGELKDEMDEGSEAEIIALKNGTYLVRADISIRRFNLEIPSVQIPEEDRYLHLSGFILSQLGRIPVAGDIIEIDAARLSVIRVAANKVLLVKVIPHPPISS